MKGHPYSAETDEKEDLHEECVDNMRTISENRKAAAFFHCKSTHENITIKWM